MLQGRKLIRLAVLSLMALAGNSLVAVAQDSNEEFFLKETPVHSNEAVDAASMFRRGADAYSRRDWRQAVIELGKYSDQFPNESLAVEALFFRAESLIELGDHGAAAKEFKRFLMIADGDHAHRRRAEFRLGESLYLTGKLDSAESSLTRFIEAYPSDALLAYALPYLADIALQRNDAEVALKLFERSIKEHDSGPMSVTCRFGLARSAEKLGQLEKARFAYSHLALSATHSAKALLHLGLLEYKIANYQGAEKALSQLIDRKETSNLEGAALYWRGMSRFARNDYANSTTDFRESLTFPHPTQDAVANLQRYLGESLIAMSKFQDAHDGLTDYLAGGTEPHKSVCRMTASVAAANLNRFDEVSGTYNALHPIRNNLPQFDHWTLRLASAAVKHREVDRARAWYKSVLLETDDAKLREIANQELKALGPADRDRDEAIDEEFATLIEQNSFKEAELLLDRLEDNVEEAAVSKSDYRWYLMAAQYRSAGDAAGDVRCLKRIHDLYPESVAWHESTYRLALNDFRAKRFDKAMAMLKKFHSKQPPVKMAPHGLFLYGQAAAGASDYSLSERKMSELVERFPEHALRNKAQYWVAEAKFRRKEYDSAERSFLELTTRLKPENRQSWMGMVPLRLAQIEAHRGQWRSALDKARAITGNYPGFRQQFEVDYLIGRCRASVGQFDAAREAYRAVLADSRANGKETAAMAQWMIGESYMHQRNYDQAVSEYLRVEVLHDWPEWRACGLFQAAKCYVAMNQKQPAIETFSRLMTRYPDSEYAGKSKLRVAALRSDAKPKVRVADRSEQNAKKSN